MKKNTASMSGKAQHDPFKAFEKTYWDKNYVNPQDMDGIFNAREHARYLKLFFDLELVEIRSLADFGMGTGHLFSAMLQEFSPGRALGIEPSRYAFSKAQKRVEKKIPPTLKLTLEMTDLLSWARRAQSEKSPVFDVGLCTSVFQYLSDKDLKVIVPALARQVKYLYFTVPVKEEFDRMLSDFQFVDDYAHVRTQAQYLKLLRPHFTVVGQRVLESRHFFDMKNTKISELFYRF